MSTTTHAPSDDRAIFYEKIMEVCENVQRYDILNDLGDFNAKIDREEHILRMTEKHLLHLQTNEK